MTQDRAKAVTLFEKAAGQGLANSQSSLGRLYWLGDGVAKNQREAVRLLQLAAEQDFAEAQAALGLAYLEGGDGVERDDVQAVHWLERGAQGGDLSALTNLGYLYDVGDAVPQNTAKATWQSPQDIKDVYAHASFVADNHVVFNIAGNRYRLIAHINHDYQIVYVKFIGTHAEYDLIDPETV